MRSQKKGGGTISQAWGGTEHAFRKKKISQALLKKTENIHLPAEKKEKGERLTLRFWTGRKRKHLTGSRPARSRGERTKEIALPLEKKAGLAVEYLFVEHRRKKMEIAVSALQDERDKYDERFFPK